MKQPKPKHRPSFPDAQRGTVAVKLRLRPEEARDLHDLAELRGKPVSRVVGDLAREALER